MVLECAVGVPQKLIDKLKMGEYEPNITEGAKRSALAKMKTATKHQKKLLDELKHDVDSLSDMHLDLNLAKEVTSIEVGSIPVEGFDDNAEAKVKEKLLLFPASIIFCTFKMPDLFGFKW